jgi:hypothetical protein
VGQEERERRGSGGVTGISIEDYFMYLPLSGDQP